MSSKAESAFDILLDKSVLILKIEIDATKACFYIEIFKGRPSSSQFK